jgi:hypothetical protein
MEAIPVSCYRLFIACSVHNNTGFTAAQATLNLIESIFNIEYLYLAYSGKKSTKGKNRMDALAPLIGFTGAVMTLSTTVLYWLQGTFSYQATSLQLMLKYHLL